MNRFDHFLSLLEREASGASHRSAPREELRRLVIRGEEPATGGHLLLTLGLRNPRTPLPWTSLRGGAPVWLRTEDTTPALRLRGLIVERSATQIRVAVSNQDNDWPDDAEWALSPAEDEVGLQRIRTAMHRAKSASSALHAVLLGDAPPQFSPAISIKPLDESLNPSQVDAVSHALTALEVGVIHGPPGTGKTTTVVELIRQAVRRGQRVLACAPSNLAVDNLLERLIAAGVNVVRLGHPARILPAVAARSLDTLASDHPDARQARKAAKAAWALFRQAGKWTRAAPAPGQRQAWRAEARALLADARRWEASAEERVLDAADVIGATLTGLDDGLLRGRRWDLAVIDEAAQATEPAAWTAILRADRLILAGDPYQLPPTILSSEAAAGGLAVSLMERLMATHGTVVGRRLQVQYRMHKVIGGFSSEACYEGELQAAEPVRGHLLTDLPGITTQALTSLPMRFFDTAGAGYDEEPDGESRCNPQEARLAARLVRELLAAGVPAEAIGVIAPYSAQVRRLRELLSEESSIDVDSVDGFQGREKEAIVLTLVRSNPTGEVGFLADTRRMNVAMTRARRLLVVIGDSATLGGHPFYSDWLAYVERVGAYGSVWEME